MCVFKSFWRIKREQTLDRIVERCADERLGAGCSLPGFYGHTVREVARVSIGGSGVVVRLTNEYGKAPIRLDAVSVAYAAEQGGVEPLTSRLLTFGGSRAIVIPPGASVISDPLRWNCDPSPGYPSATMEGISSQWKRTISRRSRPPISLFPATSRRLEKWSFYRRRPVITCFLPYTSMQPPVRALSFVSATPSPTAMAPRSMPTGGGRTSSQNVSPELTVCGKPQSSIRA